MKIKILNGILIVDILTAFLVIAIIFFPSNIARIIFGLPFLVFFPGYILISALFIRMRAMDTIEKIGLSFGLSIAIVALIGFGLNFTSWGIRLEPILFSVAAFIIGVSAIAVIRRSLILGAPSLTKELTLSFPGWNGNIFNKSASVLLALVVLGAIGVLGYAVAVPKIGEKFTEFYILGLNGKAQDYPTEFLISQGKVTGVSYDDGKTMLDENQGVITLGIVNHEQTRVTYWVVTTIDGNRIDIAYDGKNLDRIGPIELQQGQKWEQKLGFTPLNAGNNQEVEFLLYKGNGTSPDNSLHFWINVKEAGF